MKENYEKPRQAQSRLAGFFACAVAILSSTLVAFEPAPTPGATSGAVSEKSRAGRTFAPGITIDWDEPAIRVEAKVVLREGPLELFACSPQTREHESIIAVAARPLHIFQAMGLIGLESGSPPSYHETSEKWQRAHGEPLDLLVEWRDDGKVLSARPGDWMIEEKTNKPPQNLRWVFSGSVVREKDHFAADSDGTVVCVVDFDSALISIPTRHSADDAELWLSANTQVIPPVGTACTLIIRSAYHPKLEVEVDAQGRLRLADQAMSIEQIGQKLAEKRDGRTPHLFISFDGASLSGEPRKAVDDLRAELQRRGLDPAVHMTIKKTGSPRGARTLAPSP